MVQTLNFISLSSQQAPNDVDWPGLVKAGVQGALIRLGHGIIRDPCASGHIAKAKQYGLYWHGYHTYEGVVNEPQFTIKNATDLGLSNSQYYFVDLAKSSDPFNDYYALHATWLSQGYSTGLLISNDDYLSKFKDSEVIASGTLRWLISDTEPANYDVWQYSSEGTVGISSVKVGFNFSKTDKLKYNLDTTLTGADINKDPYNPETPVGGAYIGWGYDTTGLGGGKTIGYSTDGKNFYALIGPDGLIVRKNDGNRIYGTIADQIDSAISANVIPAKSAADSAVSAADAAVASAQVTSDAVTAIASATAEAKAGANDAMSRAKSAWDVATSATNAASSAQSDAKQATSSVAALSTSVDTLKGSVTDLQAESTTQANEIKNKVTRSDVTGMLTGYATQEYAQGLVTLKADEWNLNLTKLKNDTQTSLTQLAVGVEGVQAQVYNSDGSSKITQLSNLIATKVSQGDYNSQITQLKNDINLRVAKGDVISQINQEAGGDTLIQVSNGKKSLILDAGNTIITGKAWIPSAAIANLDASKLTFYGADNTYATMGASVVQYDDDKTKSTINLQYSGGIEIHSSNQQGSILTMHDNTIRLASKTWGDNSNPYQYSGFYAAPNYSLMNTYHKDGTSSGVAIDDNRIWIYGSSKDQQLGALQADVGWYSINGKTGLLTGNQIALKATTTQVTLSDRNINIENTIDTNSKNYDVGIHIKGWAEMTGWFTCMGLTQTSLLSTKTRIEPLDTAKALELINSADVATYQYKQEVAHGGTKRHASVIIDDVNDVAQYQTPDEIISEDRQGRNDGDIVGYLMGSVQELTKRIKILESKVG